MLKVTFISVFCHSKIDVAFKIINKLMNDYY
jgi:hypothetical protein